MWGAALRSTSFRPKGADVKQENRVYLIGSGPGDPELLTVKALRLLEQADVVVYDRLVSSSIIELVPASTSRIFVGKEPGRHHMVQDDINDLLVKLAKQNRKVVRLKGGDPYIFGRGSEEARYLKLHGVTFEIVPGITAATACSAYAGIPLTHRGLSNGVRFVTGHCREDQPLDLNWQKLADPDMTIVIYMGLANLPQMQRELKHAGLSDTTPVAIVERGTTTEQRLVLTTLCELASRARSEKVESPALVIVGRVVSLAEELEWFSNTAAFDEFYQENAIEA